MTRYSPAKLKFGYEPQLLVDLMTGKPPQEGLPADAARRQEDTHQIRDALKFFGEAMKCGYDERAKQVNCYQI